MKATNFGVSDQLFAEAVSLADTMCPPEGYRGNNWEAPPFCRDKAAVEVRPYSHGRFAVSVVQDWRRIDTTSNGGRVVYPAKFTFANRFVK